MMDLSIWMGEAYGFSVMKFTLVFEGELRANGSPAQKQKIREQFHPQLAELWADHPCLKALPGRRYISLTDGGHMWWESHHSIEVPEAQLPKPLTLEGMGETAPSHVDLCAPVIIGGHSFNPLVRERTALKCALKIIFLRHEPPGRIYQGGDIDNRLKTLLDALSVPQHDEQVIPGSTSPMFCLLEDNSLITGLDVQTQRLLAKPNASKHDVHLLIEVDVRVTTTRLQSEFLGD